LGLTAPLPPLLVNQTFVVSLSDRNLGPQASTGATLIVPANPAFRFVSASNTTCTPSAAGFNCTLGAVPAGGRLAFTLTLRALQAGTTSVALILHGNEPDPDQGNSIRTSRVTVR
jgi:hypothetical protein